MSLSVFDHFVGLALKALTQTLCWAASHSAISMPSFYPQCYGKLIVIITFYASLTSYICIILSQLPKNFT